MINPKQVTNFDRTDDELQAFWVFCIIVAGRNSDFAARKTLELLAKKGEKTTFEFLQENLLNLRNTLVAHRVGQYGRITTALERSLSLNLRTATLEGLTSIFGVGPKTARFFLLHTRRDCQHVVLDVHILRYLRTQFPNAEIRETATPTNTRRYEEIERLAHFLLTCNFPGLSMAEIDLAIWLKESGRLEE